MTQPDPTNRFATQYSRFSTLSCELLNRDFKTPGDGWFQIAPIGEFRGVANIDGEEKPIIQLLDREAIDELARNFGKELLVDYEHFAHDPDKETRAAGWITAVQARPDGLYAQIRLSSRGKSDIEGGEYRFISPEFDLIKPAGGEKWRPVRLTGAGLTNKPALTTLAPLSNREPAGGGNQKTTTERTKMDYKAILLKVLGLSATASDEDIQKAADSGDSVPDMQKTVETANREIKQLRETVAESDMAGVELDDETKAVVREALVTDRAKGLKIMAALRKTGASEGKPSGTIFDRKQAKTPKTGADIASAGKADDVRAARIYNRANEIMRQEGIPWGIAFNRAEAETAEAK